MTAVLFVLIVSFADSPAAGNSFRQSLRLCYIPQGDGFKAIPESFPSRHRRFLGGSWRVSA